MKTKLLRRLRKEALTECPCEELQAFAEYVGWSHDKTRRRIQAKKDELHPPPRCGAKTEEKMKTKVTFKDSFDDNKISVEIIYKKNIRLEMGDSDVWLSLDDFEEFIQECTRLAVKLKESKKNEE